MLLHAACPVLPLVDIAPLLPARGALIGLDLGTKTIGVAVSDPDRKLAAGVTTVARKAFTADANAVLALAAERRAAGYVLGLPVNMDGTEGPRAQSTRAFARNFARLTALPIGLWDERLSTAAVERDLIAADMSRARARRGDRPACGGVHPAGRARSPRAAAVATLDMQAVLAALLPVFLLIIAGVLLRRFLIEDDQHWVGMERLLYYVMFPALLIDTLARADLTKVPVLAVGGTLLAAVLIMSGLCLALRPLLARRLGAMARPSRRSSRARPAGRPSWRSRSPAICSAISGSRSPRSRWWR